MSADDECATGAAVDVRTKLNRGRGLAGLRRDVSLSAVLAGFVTVVVSYSGTLVIVLAAASAGKLSPEQTASWVWAISVGSGVTCIGLSLATRTPVITAWSTPGAALLVTSLGEHPYPEAIGAFLLVGVAMTVIGLTGLFGRLMRAVPPAVVSAMLAGILFSFGAELFTSLSTAPVLVLVVLVAYLCGKRWWARYAVLGSLLVGVLAAAAGARLHITVDSLDLVRPVWTTPEFSVSALIGVAVPLLVATLGSQQAPGLGVLRASGYEPRDRLLIGATGLTSTALAPFGSHAVNLAAITAAICTGPEAHRDPARRYVAGVSCGVCYLVIGAFGATVVGLFTGLPKELVAGIAGVALLGALSGSLTEAVRADADREAAVLTFLATASGVTLFGVGSAFWGLVCGLGTHWLLNLGVRRSVRSGAPDSN